MPLFKYPNADILKRLFIGCGGYAAFDDYPGRDFTHLTSTIIKQELVERAAEILTYTPKHLSSVVYEKKKAAPWHGYKYAGESLHLAYLCALIHRSRAFKWPTDCWCTGRIELAGNQHPALCPVAQEEFVIKLKAFLTQPEDRLFIVPAANMSAHERARCEAAKVNVISLDEFEATSIDMLSLNIVLTVGPNDLYHLISKLFQLGENPYKGLEAFEEQDADRFFGREELIASLWNAYRLLQEPAGPHPFRFLALIGPSGSGKSSVARAGLIPKLKHDLLPGMNASHVIVFKPGADPIHRLAEQCARVLNTDHPNHDHIKEDDALLKQQPLTELSLMIPKGFDAPLVMLVDQFEEIYGPHVPESDQENFIESLLALAHDQNVNVFVLIILRSDFLAHTQHYPELNAAITSPTHHILVPSMRVRELRAAIREPAKRAGYLFSEHTLDDLLEDSHKHEGVLPLLEFTLTRMWEGLKKGVPPHEMLKQIGGVGGALAGEAQKIYDSLRENEKRIARRAFLAMINVGESGQHTRRRVFIAEILGHQETSSQVHGTLLAFSHPGARLITLASAPPHAETAEITHEALFEHWRALKTWLEESRDELRFQHLLEDAARTWKEQDRPTGSLWWQSPNVDRLRTFQQNNQQDMNALQIEFFKASLRRHQGFQRLKVGAIIGLILLTIGFAGVGVWQYFKTIEANQNQITAFTQTARTFFRSHNELDALLAGLKAGHVLHDMKFPRRFGLLPDALSAQTLDTLREVTYSIREKSRLQATAQIAFDVNFSPDGKWLASANQDYTIKLWNLIDASDVRTLTGHADVVYSIAFSPDSTQLVSGGLDRTVRLWDIATGQERHKLSTHTDIVYGVDFSPDGTRIASGSFDRTIKVWDVVTGQELHTLFGHSDAVYSVAFSPDGKFLASGSFDKTIKLWNVAEGRELKTLSGHEHWVMHVAFSPDSTLLASGSFDATLKLWSIPDGKEIQPSFSMGYPSFWFLDVAFSPDGKLLASASADATIRVWDVARRQELLHFPGQTIVVWSVAFSPDGTLLASGGSDGTVKVWNLVDDKIVRTLTEPAPVNSMALSPDGLRLATGTETQEIAIWDVADGHHITTLPGHTGWVYYVSFSPDGSRLASGSSDRTIKLWNFDQRKEIRTFSGHAGEVYGVVFSPDGKTLVSASEDATLKVWNVADGRELRTLTGHQDVVSCVAMSPDGKRIASGSFDQTIKLWNVADGQEVYTLDGHKDWVQSLAFSPNGTLLASGGQDATIKLWDVTTGKEVRTLSGHTKPVNSLIFSPDGVLLASGSGDKTVKFWNVADGQEIMHFSGHSDDIESVAFSPDGKVLVSGSRDMTIKFWDMAWRNAPLADVLARGCQWLNNYLQYNPHVNAHDREVCHEQLSQ